MKDSMATARLFKSGSGQAVRLPREIRIDESEVVIKKVGHAVLLLPLRFSARAFREVLLEIGPMQIRREQPPT